MEEVVNTISSKHVFSTQSSCVRRGWKWVVFEAETIETVARMRKHTSRISTRSGHNGNFSYLSRLTLTSGQKTQPKQMLVVWLKSILIRCTNIGGTSYIGIAGNIGLDGDTSLGEVALWLSAKSADK